MGEEFVAALVTGAVVVGIVAVIYQFTKNKTSASVANKGFNTFGTTVNDMFKA